MDIETMLERIPADFPVQPIDPDGPAKDAATCGTCGLTWDDGIPTSWTPAPSGRCPFEYFHEWEDFDHLRAMDGLPQASDDDGAGAFARGVLELTARLRSEGALSQETRERIDDYVLGVPDGV